MFDYGHDDDYAPVATMSDAVSEWARNVGYYPRFAGSQWLHHDYDVWVRNPHYVGPDQGHPEDDEHTPEQVAARDFAERIAHDDRPLEYWATRAPIRTR